MQVVLSRPGGELLDVACDLRQHRRMGFRVALLASIAALLARPALAAEEPEPVPALVEPGPFDGLARHFAGAFAGMNLTFQLAGVAATATISSQEVDLQAHNYFHDHPTWGKAAYPFAILGVAGPVALFGGLHVVGRARGNVETVGAAYAVLQATGLTLGYVTVLKFFTGRPAPRDDYVPGIAADMNELSRTFRPGLCRGGVIAGWPSGHVAVTTAALGALVAYYPDSMAMKVLMAAGVLGMMYGVSSFERGGFHWASDAVAGALMSFPIGMSTGKGMRALVSGQRLQPRSTWFVTPSLRAETVGAMVGRAF
jgi:membrane-associated phospholipid phosphatase